jgi:hypothetical protein
MIQPLTNPPTLNLGPRPPALQINAQVMNEGNFINLPRPPRVQRQLGQLGQQLNFADDPQVANNNGNPISPNIVRNSEAQDPTSLAGGKRRKTRKSHRKSHKKLHKKSHRKSKKSRKSMKRK